MSRTAALWTSAVLTLAFVLIVGTALLRPSLSRSTPAEGQLETTLVGDAGASRLSAPAQQAVYEHDDDHGDHHHSDGEHDDDD